MNNFDKFLLPEPMKKALNALKFTEPTPIQEKAIPVAISRRDVIGCAQTGTGKTLAFLIPTVFHLLKSPRKQALVLVPTRELADQVSDMLSDLLKFIPEIKSTVVIGGVPMFKQTKALALSPRVIVATPGRLCDHLRRGGVSLRAIEILILDEADRMLEMGFTQQLNEIMRFVPSSRQTLLFSATFPPAIEKLAQKYMNTPVRINAGNVEAPVKVITQQALHVANSNAKKATLKSELGQRQGSVVVFTRTKHRADNVYKFLVDSGHSTGRIHGGRNQSQRTRTLESFKAGKVQILVATDVVSRGIDVANIAHVINFDLPQSPEDYIHRIGRTARAGASGQALSLIAPEERGKWKEISHLLEKSR